jgi:hypothetical protein
MCNKGFVAITTLTNLPHTREDTSASSTKQVAIFEMKTPHTSLSHSNTMFEISFSGNTDTTIARKKLPPL